MATTLGTNILCTALIVARIIYVARGHRGIIGGIRTYRGVPRNFGGIGSAVFSHLYSLYDTLPS